jgi:CheY-like chemotaxis protein
MNDDTLHILLADENESERALFIQALEGIRIKTTISYVEDGFSLLEYLDNSRFQLPDLIFIDINIKGISAIECLSNIRSNSHMKDLAIGFYSTIARDEIIEEAFVKGANVFINRPFDYHAFREILTQVVIMFWQYHTSGLKKENFMLNINHNKVNGRK